MSRLNLLGRVLCIVAKRSHLVFDLLQNSIGRRRHRVKVLHVLELLTQVPLNRLNEKVQIGQIMHFLVA